MYFETESLQNNIGEDLDRRNRNFEKIETDTTLMATNLVSNGDFSNGTDDTAVYNGTMSALNGELILLSNTSFGNVRKSISVTLGNKYYIRSLVKSTSPLVNMNITGNLAMVSHRGSGSYELLSNVWVSTATALYNVRIQDERASGWDNVYVKYILAINLTATFGAGNEPTVEQMDEIMSKFPNSWFDGTKNLFRASETLKKQIAMDARTEFEAKNLVVNGDFSNGTTGWATTNGALSSSNNILTITGNGTSLQITTTTPIGNIYNNRKYRVGAKIRVTNAICTNLQIRLYDGVNYLLYNINNPVQNQWYSISHMITALNSTAVGRMEVITIYSDTPSSIGQVTEVMLASTIDLTATFGAGKEPTLAEMDRLMARFPNSWFDGTKPIQTIETLYQEKANKVQEAWITPTLVNGWVAGINVPAYMKDEMGFVHIKGQVKSGTTYAFVLPVGYRPSQITRIPINANGQFGFVNIQSGGEVYITGNNTDVYLDGVTFRTV